MKTANFNIKTSQHIDPSADNFDLLTSRIEDYIFLNNNEVEFVKSLLEEEHFKNNEIILKEGDACKKLCFEVNGLVLNVNNKKNQYSAIQEMRFDVQNREVFVSCSKCISHRKIFE
jgi:hypothetical protein